MAMPTTPDQRADALASRQHGAIAHQQALTSGLSARQVEGRLGRRRWNRAARGVYVVSGAPDTSHQRAWVATLATGGILSHPTSLWLHGLWRPSPVPHVTVDRGRSTRSGVAVVHRGTVPMVDRATVDGLRCTSASRALVDAAVLLDGPSFEELLDDALCRKVASTGSIEAAADRIGRGRRGLGLVRQALVVWTEDIRPGSVAEVRLLRVLADLGLAGLVSQHDVFDGSGAFVARLDLADPARRCALEYDGRRRHNPRYWARDEPRYARLRALGWDVAPISKIDLLPGETRLRELVGAWNHR